MLAVAVLLYKAKHYRLTTAWSLVWATFFYLAPVKIDGTESHKAHRVEQVKANAYHNTHSSASPDAEIVNVKKLSFNEQMALEGIRSEKANQKVTYDIIK